MEDCVCFEKLCSGLELTATTTPPSKLMSYVKKVANNFDRKLPVTSKGYIERLFDTILQYEAVLYLKLFR